MRRLPLLRLMVLMSVSIVLGLCLATTTFAGSLSPDEGLWFELAPPIRSGHCAVYDSVNNRMFVFGGDDAQHDFVLDLDGAGAWMHLVTTGAGPASTVGARAAYDRVHGRILLVGGAASRGLWQLSLDRVPHWTQLAAGTTPVGGWSPFFRSVIPDMVYDEVRDRLVCYDGDLGFHDFEIEGAVMALSVVSPTGWTGEHVWNGRGPERRQGAAVAYDSKRHRLLVFAGSDPDGVSTDDLWAVSLDDDTTWTQLAPVTGWWWRLYASAVYDEIDDRMLVAGGLDDHRSEGGISLPDLVAFPLEGDSDPVRLGGFGAWAGTCHGSLVLDARARRAIFHGGLAVRDGTYGSTRACPLDEGPGWVPVGPGGMTPKPRGSMGAAFDPVRARMISFGGRSSCYGWGCSTRAHNDVSVRGPRGWEAFSVFGGPPAGRWEHATVFDTARRRALVHGGRTGTEVLGDVWALTLSDAGTAVWEQFATPEPGPHRAGHVACYDAPRDRMVVFGGQDSSGARNDVWALELGGSPGWTQLSPAGTPPSSGHKVVAVHDPVHRRLLAIETWDSSGVVRAEVKALDLEGEPAWSRVAVAGTIPSTGFDRAVYDPNRDRVLGFGGSASSVVGLDLAGTPTWRALAPAGPFPAGRSGHAVVYDAALDRALLYGGDAGYGTYYADVWALQFGTSYLAAEAVAPPVRFGLAHAGANPTRGEVRIRVDLPAAASVRVEVFDLAGRRVATPMRRGLEAGRHVVEWDGLGAGGVTVPAGVYLVRVTAGRESGTTRVVRLH